MTIQETIIKALEASHTAHESAVARIEMMASERTTLVSKVAELEAKVKELEAQSVNIVEPSAVQPLLTALAEVVIRMTAAVRPVAAVSQNSEPGPSNDLPKHEHDVAQVRETPHEHHSEVREHVGVDG